MSELVLPPTARSRAEAPAWLPERGDSFAYMNKGRCALPLQPGTPPLDENGFGDSLLVFRDANSFGVSYSDGKIFLHERGRDKS